MDVRKARENPSAVSSKKREAAFLLRILRTLEIETQDRDTRGWSRNEYRKLPAVSQAVVLVVKSR